MFEKSGSVKKKYFLIGVLAFSVLWGLRSETADSGDEYTEANLDMGGSSLEGQPDCAGSMYASTVEPTAAAIVAADLVEAMRPAAPLPRECSLCAEYEQYERTLVQRPQDGTHMQSSGKIYHFTVCTCLSDCYSERQKLPLEHLMHGANFGGWPRCLAVLAPALEDCLQKAQLFAKDIYSSRQQMEREHLMVFFSFMSIFSCVVLVKNLTTALCSKPEMVKKHAKRVYDEFLPHIECMIRNILRLTREQFVTVFYEISLLEVSHEEKMKLLDPRRIDYGFRLYYDIADYLYRNKKNFFTC